MTRLTTLIIVAIAFLKGVSSLTAAAYSVTSPPCGGIDHNPLPATFFVVELSSNSIVRFNGFLSHQGLLDQPQLRALRS
jgi:hypothetical protein